LVGIGAAALVLVAILLLSFSSGADISGDTQQRIAAVARIVSEKPSGAADKVDSIARSDPAAEVRAVAVAGALQLGRHETVQAALADSAPRVRATAAELLSRTPDTQAAQTLAQMYKTDQDPQVRTAALRGLARCTAPESIVTLLEACESAPDKADRQRALQLLAVRVGGRAAVVPTPDTPEWLDAVERMKRIKQVQRAFASAGVPLTRHPEHLINFGYTEHDTRAEDQDHDHDH
jgi:HEAT repeat protein